MLTYRFYRIHPENCGEEAWYLKNVIADIHTKMCATSCRIEIPIAWHEVVDTDYFFDELSKLTRITDLELCNDTERIDHEKYLENNKTLTSLTIRLGLRKTDPICSLMQLYHKNTILKSLVLRLRSVPNKHRLVFTTQICDLISRNTTLQNLEIHGMQFTRSQTKSILSQLNLNCTLTGFWLVDSDLKSEKCVSLLKQNTVLKSLRLKLNPSHDTPAIYRYIKRNIAMGIHVRILNYSLIFHSLPAYVLLEILDWLPDLYTADHVTKIHLIINLKRSIDMCKK